MYNDSRNTDKLRLLTDIVHKYDSKIIAQISYPGHHGSKMKGQLAKRQVAYRRYDSFFKKDINQCIINHVTTIEFLQKVGFDGVQLHMAHGYLLSEFLDSFYNKRTDNYGGNINNRYRIIHEILMKLNKTIEDNFLITAKIDTISKEEDKEFINQQIQVCKWLERDGIDAIEKSGTNFKSSINLLPYFWRMH